MVATNCLLQIPDRGSSGSRAPAAHSSWSASVDEQVVGSEPQRATVAAVALGEPVEGRAHAERGQDMRRNLETEMAPDLPGLLVARKVNFAAHDPGGELVARGEPLLLDADRVVRILILGAVTDTRALAIAEGGATPRIHHSRDRGVGVRGRVMDLRDVVHRRDTVIELAERAEQLIDVHVLRPVHGSEREENVLVVIDVPARRAG